MKINPSTKFRVLQAINKGRQSICQCRYIWKLLCSNNIIFYFRAFIEGNSDVITQATNRSVANNLQTCTRYVMASILSSDSNTSQAKEGERWFMKNILCTTYIEVDPCMYSLPITQALNQSSNSSEEIVSLVLVFNK